MRYCVAILSIGFLFPLLVAAADSAPDAAAQKEAVAKLEKDWADASKAGDAKKVEEQLSDDFTLTGPTGAMLDKERYVSDICDHTLVLDSVKLDDVNVRIYGNAAVVTATLAISGKHGDFDLTGSYRITDTLIKTNDKWQKVAEQVTATRD